METVKYGASAISKIQWYEDFLCGMVSPYHEYLQGKLNIKSLLATFLGGRTQTERSALYMLLCMSTAVDTNSLSAQKVKNEVEILNSRLCDWGISFGADFNSVTSKGKEIEFERLSSLLCELNSCVNERNDLSELEIEFSKFLYEQSRKALDVDKRMGKCYTISPQIAEAFTKFGRFKNVSLATGFVSPYSLSIAKNLHTWVEFNKENDDTTMVADMTTNLIMSKEDYEYVMGAETKSVLTFEQYIKNCEIIVNSVPHKNGTFGDISQIEPLLFPNEITADAQNDTIAPRKKCSILDKAQIIGSHFIKRNYMTTFFEDIKEMIKIKSGGGQQKPPFEAGV